MEQEKKISDFQSALDRTEQNTRPGFSVSNILLKDLNL